MDVVVDLAHGVVALTGRDALDSLSVRVDAPASDAAQDRLTDALARAGIGRVDGTEMPCFPPRCCGDWPLRRRHPKANTSTPTGMRGSTECWPSPPAEGWIDDDGAVRAHVEWRDA